MAISIGHLRESFVADFATVGVLAAMHVYMVLDVVQLRVALAAVLAGQPLTLALGLLVRDDALVVSIANAL